MEVLNKEQLAEKLGCSLKTIERHISCQIDPIPTNYLGSNMARFIWDDVVDWLRNRTIKQKFI